MAPIGKLYGVDLQRQTKVIRAAAALAGVELELAPFQFGVTNTSAEFRALAPYGKIPVFQGADGLILSEGDAIARHVASLGPKALLGNDAAESALINQWIHFAESEINIYSDLTWQLTQGWIGDYNDTAYKVFQERQERALKFVNEHLSTRTFLVTNTITLADVALAAVAFRAGRTTLGSAKRSVYSHLYAHYEKVSSDLRLKDIFGESGFVDEPIAFKPKDA